MEEEMKDDAKKAREVAVNRGSQDNYYTQTLRMLALGDIEKKAKKQSRKLSQIRI